MAEGQSRIPAADGEAAMPARSINSQDLLEGHREVLIKHGAEVYRLRLTSNNKLILMK